MIRRVFFFFFLVGVIGIASTMRREVWDGSFPQAEYQVTFVDQEKRPVKGVKLEVIDAAGNISYGYPVADYREGWIPTSDEKGTVIFHHIDLSPEFGGSCRKLFFLFPLGGCQTPQYTLRFLRSGEVMASFKYEEHLGAKPDWKTLPKVERKWEAKAPSPHSLPKHLCTEDRSLPSVLVYPLITQTVVVPSSLSGNAH